jgi:hypothetical protein
MSFFIFPPHPQKANCIHHSSLKLFENRGGWIAQRKYNGTHVVVYVRRRPNETVDFDIWDRRGSHLTLYHAPETMITCFLGLNIKRNHDYVFAGELLHTKAKSKITGQQAATNTIVLFDVLHAEHYLIDLTQRQRLELLSFLCRNPDQLEPKGRALVVATAAESNLWLAETFDGNYLEHFYEMFDFHIKTGEDKYPEIEGLVLRLENSHLAAGDRLHDVEWMMRVRKKSNKYQF